MIFSPRKRTAARPSTAASVPEGYRAYAIGDVHGRLDLLDRMLGRIEADIAQRGAAKNHIVMLGDLIDRGPDSCRVIERLRTYQRREVKLVVLCGNHEEALLRLLGGDAEPLDGWLSFGGTETMRSYGVDPDVLHRVSVSEAMGLIRDAVPPSHQHFLDGLVDTVKIGDYLFVHAGIRPGVHLSMQLQQDLRWIRQPFLEHTGDQGFVVVHGHTISTDVVERRNRIGIDTGAYSTGRLSAVGLEGQERWFLEAR